MQNEGGEDRSEECAKNGENCTEEWSLGAVDPTPACNAMKICFGSGTCSALLHESLNTKPDSLASSHLGCWVGEDGKHL